MTIKDWAETIQAIVTTIGIVLAGIWSFYTFVLGRSHSPNIEIEFKIKQTIGSGDQKATIIAIKIKNIGKTRVKKRNCYIATIPIEIQSVKNTLARLDEPFNLGDARLYEIFNQHAYLEPNEIANEDVLISTKEADVFKIGLFFLDNTNKLWNSNAIFRISNEYQSSEIS